MKTRIKNSKQTGATLMEVLVAMSISLVVTAAMIAMMANSLGTTARIVKMTKLTDDMRVALQMMSRDVRRSNYNADSMFCYANEDCASEGITSAGKVDISLSNDCFWFLTDREHDNYASDIAAGAFRRTEVDPDGDEIFVGVLLGMLIWYTMSEGARNAAIIMSGQKGSEAWRTSLVTFVD